MTGLAPDSQHCARYRSTRRGLKSLSSAETSSAGTAFFQSSPCQNPSKYEFHPQPISDPAVDTDKSSRSHRQHTAAVSAKSKQRCSDGLELREGCCGQFLPAAETHPPARTLLMVRTGASVAELAVLPWREVGRDSNHSCGSG